MVLSDRVRMLASTIQKLHHRGAVSNIQRILGKTHEADIAGVLQMLAEEEAVEIFRLETSVAERAKILSYMESDYQKRFLEHLGRLEASDVVGEMESDDAADLLSQLSVEDSKEIIESLVTDEGAEVVELMGYPEDSAGGIMTSDFLAFEEDVTVDQVVKELQRDEGDQRISFYAYVINKTGHLVGVVSLKQLLLSVKATRLSDLMTANVIAVKTNTDQEHVASTVALYDFLSVPVVDESNKLVGVITVDDVIDVIKQEAEEDLLAMGQAGWGLDMSWSEHLLARLPWLFLSFLVGAASYALIYFWGPRGEAWSFLAILPLVLSLGAMAGNQTATVLVGALRTGKFWGGKFYFHMLRELGMSLLLAFIFSGIVLALGHWLLPDDEWKNVFASAVAIQIIAAMLFGAWLPVLFNKLKLDPAIMTPPTYAALADFSAIIILLGLYHVG